MEDRLRTDLWVSANVVKCNAEGMPVYITNKGAAESGTVILKIIVSPNNCRVLNQFRSDSGEISWMDIYDGQLVSEDRAGDYIKQALDRDPDVWVLEIESRDGKNPFEGKIV